METKHPRTYLSWSALNLWETNRKDFILRYVYGEKGWTNEAMKLGKEVATALEKDVQSDDPLIENARIFLPKIGVPEFEIKVDIGGFDGLGKLDRFDEANMWIDEVKTGKVPWNQYRVDNHGQLTFYAMLIYKKYGVLPKKITLHYMPTGLVEGGQDGLYKLGLTGEIIAFETSRGLADVYKMMARCKKAWKEIGEVCASEFASIGL